MAPETTCPDFHQRKWQCGHCGHIDQGKGFATMENPIDTERFLTLCPSCGTVMANVSKAAYAHLLCGVDGCERQATSVVPSGVYCGLHRPEGE